jgi:hypothetical protein
MSNSIEPSRFLVFGDLHGRVLPAFALARRYMDDFQHQLDGLFQVGDLGYFPDPARLDSASRRHAAKDSLELGVSEFHGANPVAAKFFERFDPVVRLYFIAGNHEDHERLHQQRRVHDPAWPVDDFHRLWCLDDGRILTLPSGLRIAGLWGIDADAPQARRIRTRHAVINKSAATRLLKDDFDVLITHESPRDAIWFDSGSLEISEIIERRQPQLAFFGHYHTAGRLDQYLSRRTKLYWMPGMELQHHGRTAEPNSVGILTYAAGEAQYESLPSDWLSEFTRDNWMFWLEW